jgi:UDP-N-acetylmuramoyl-tripeptide--D-alanyl-D-alanine ligase
MKRYLSGFLPGYVSALVYMLQSTEYQVKPYLAWYRRAGNFRTVAKRRTLELTRPARMLRVALGLGIALQIAVAAGLVWWGVTSDAAGPVIAGIVIFVLYPTVWAHLVVIPLILGRLLLIGPKERRLVAESKVIFAQHPATIIGIAGSYGKTTVKELLGTVLGSARRVAITPANKNVAISHAQFARSLQGDEKVLVIEYGEGKPGDVARFSQTTQPDIGVITGIAPAHLDQYPSLAAAEADIFSLADYVGPNATYVNRESAVSESWQKAEYTWYDRDGIGGLKVSDVSVDLDGTRFTLSDGKQKLTLHSYLLGRHMIGPLALAAKIALDLGMAKEEVEAAVAQTKSFEHRMQPRSVGGGWIIDDTYNGNLEGFRAGLALLKELPAKRKMYVTPGLVDQGEETERVHAEIGRLIADANPTKVVLMQNSVSGIIQSSLESSGYEGEVVVENDPLAFYTNLEHFIAAGDLVLMQNDWTDNYA